MPRHIDALFLREALVTELSHSTAPRTVSISAYDRSLLGDEVDGMHAWWRDPHFVFDDTFDHELALTAIRSALLSHRSVDVILVTLDLQLMCRACLRLGAWNLLADLLGALIRLLRQSCPTPLRMSRVTGLIAEWSLAAGLPDLAMLYADESLAWGAEPHRIRSYIAYALINQHPSISSPIDQIHWFLSMEATRLQSALESRQIFALLHNLRLRCLSRLLSKTDSRLHDEALLLRDAKPLMESTSASPIPLALGHLALALCQDPSVAVGQQDRTTQACQILRHAGRWRDLMLLSMARPDLCGPLSEQSASWLKQLDGLTTEMNLPKAGPVDRDYLARLPRTMAALPHAASVRFLSCI